VEEIESRLEIMEAFLERAGAWSVAQPVLPNVLRQQILGITQISIRTGYSPELHQADVALTSAIHDFQFGRIDDKLDAIREHLREYREAALSTHHRHTPIQRLIETAFNRRSWDEAIAEAA
jgi:hypothetical protein